MAERYRVADVEDALRKAGGLKTVAAKALGCNRRTLYRYIERHPRLAKIEADAREELKDVAKFQMAKHIHAGHFPAVKWYLACFASDEGWVEPTRLEGRGGGPIEVETKAAVQFYLPDNGRDPDLEKE